MYTFQSRIRYSEISQKKTLDLSNVINYFQDCSTFQSEDIGVGLDYLTKQKKVWILNGWQIIINELPKLADQIVVGTWAYDFKGFYGYRNFIMKDLSDKIYAYANSVWIYMDTESYRPVKVTEDAISAYQMEPRFPMEYADRKIKIPEKQIEFPSFQVIKANIDTNNHVNNCQYIKMAEEYLPQDFTVHQIRAEYRKSAVLGDIVIPKVSLTEQIVTVTLSAQDKTPYAVIEFTR